MSEMNTTQNTYPVYPGTPLRVGSSGSNVTTMQQYLNGLGVVYTGINRLSTDGKYGAMTRDAVRRFQKQFSLNADGVIGQNTWNAILAVYLSVAAYRPLDVTTSYPGVLSAGSSGDHVRFIQSYLNTVKRQYNFNWPTLTVDGRFGANTALAVAGYQSAYNLSIDGKVGRNTWASMIPEFNRVIKM
ncbi:MAG: peptidoglycan-binding protein [Ruminococcaceae bacterium]|nr:peptidoglycan-binding protein [Oscillospiraceae bacterium]